MEHFKTRLSFITHLGLTSSSKHLWFLKIQGHPHGGGMGENEVGVQVFLVSSKDIARGIYWGL